MLKTFQRLIWNWGVAAFGSRHMTSKYERALRMLEEAVELAQACEVPKEKAGLVVDYVYSRPSGDAYTELGDVFMTTLALTANLGYDAEDVLTSRFMVVTSKPFERYYQRNQEKIDAGLG